MTFRTPFLAAALLTSVAAVGLSPALAQNTPTPATSEAVQPSMHHHARMLPSQLVDGLAALLSAPLFVFLGFRFGRHLQQVIELMKRYQLIAVGLLLAVFLAWAAIHLVV